MSDKPRKPRLTAQTVQRLRTLAAYAEAECEVLLSDGTDEQRQMADDVWKATTWVRGMCRWYEATHNKEGK